MLYNDDRPVVSVYLHGVKQWTYVISYTVSKSFAFQQLSYVRGVILATADEIRDNGLKVETAMCATPLYSFP